MRGKALDIRPIILTAQRSNTHWVTYRVAGLALRSDTPLPIIPGQEPRKSGNQQSAESTNSLEKKLDDLTAGSLPAVQGETAAWLCGCSRTVRYQFYNHDTLLDIDGLGTFLIAPGQMAAGRVDSAARPLAVEHAAEIILGPLLTPLLAERGIFCLHASAVLTPQGALVFVGESGAGKSTLAAWLAGNTGDSLLIADDVLAVTLRGDRLVAFTDYPQLKLTRDQQPALTSGGTVPVIAAIVLQEPDADVGLVKQTGASSAAALSRHTVASRLFHPRLLSDHFAFCSSAAARSRVYHLTYPRAHAALPEVAARLSSVLH